jgi:hypothetical protein
MKSKSTNARRSLHRLVRQRVLIKGNGDANGKIGVVSGICDSGAEVFVAISHLMHTTYGDWPINIRDIEVLSNGLN